MERHLCPLLPPTPSRLAVGVVGVAGGSVQGVGATVSEPSVPARRLHHPQHPRAELGGAQTHGLDVFGAEHRVVGV